MKEEYTITRFLLGREGTVVPDHFFIVTGHNPFGQTVSREENIRVNEILCREIEHESWPYFAVTGRCADHAEDGFGIVCSRDEAVMLGRKFRQEAIYEVRNDQVLLVDCRNEEEDVFVGCWTDLLLSES